MTKEEILYNRNSVLSSLVIGPKIKKSVSYPCNGCQNYVITSFYAVFRVQLMLKKTP